MYHFDVSMYDLLETPLDMGYLHDPYMIQDSDITTTDELMTHLSNVDYSLNSPLIADEIQGFLNWSKGNVVDKRWNLQKFDRMEKLFGKEQLMSCMDPVQSFANWFGRFNLSVNYQPNQGFLDLLNEAYKLSLITKPVVDAFFKGWIGSIPDTSKLVYSKLINEAKRWGCYFWELHQLALFLNCTNQAEAQALCKQFKHSKHLGSHCGHEFSLHLDNFGKVKVGHGFALFSDHNLFLDRNAILMMKDVYVARFNTLLSVQFRLDNLYPFYSLDTLTQMYKLGDQILVEGGNLGYDSIKLLEPICINRIAELAQRYRPLIPLFQEFPDHIGKTIAELMKRSPTIRVLKDLVDKVQDTEVLLAMYGSFRHWGHPFIDYLQGLDALYQQTTLPKLIDLAYTESLASDLALLVIRDQFRTKKQWPVDLSVLPKTHLLHQFIQNKSWPDNATIKNFGDNWHKLPLIKCFEIPDVIDPAQIYSDKSHSITRNELRAFLRGNHHPHIPSRKVLSSLLSEPATEWPKFLQKVNDHGIDENHLIIGLKAKERELKTVGRFFALMSWQIRDYFVMTEYLVKNHFVPLFKGLTMADDLTTVMAKMIESSSGQGGQDYDQITIANHIDYTKWNNHQRKESTDPVFKVMGQFLGYPNLMTRTHEIFEKSWIYYNNRGDLMGIDAYGNLVNTTKVRVCWQGQQGGLEGLRQKGWSVNNLLVIQRESNSVNTRVKVLAQGDNQVICTQYKLRPHRTLDDQIRNIRDIINNNQILLDRVTQGTSKLGLIINQDETVQSADFLVYGKTCVFRGNIRNLETKRWSRVTCVTNDQLPTLANTLSSVSSNALTVAHYSLTPTSAIYHYNFIGHFARLIVEIHNPAIRASVYSYTPQWTKSSFSSLGYLVSSLYLDPSLGGTSGISLSRFLVRGFPDPITESLSFLKCVHDNTTDTKLRQLLITMGNPVIASPRSADITKLLEDPLSLNIARGLDANTMIKDQIKNSLISGRHTIGNAIIKHAVKHQSQHELPFLQHLMDITPLFPRFLSEYRAATYFGITDSLIGLFQNSKTIRNQFKGKLTVKYDKVVIDSELSSLKRLLSFNQLRDSHIPMWRCSAHQADKLRQLSWRQPVHGATIPHPLELFNRAELASQTCKNCKPDFPYCMYISTLIPTGVRGIWDHRGTCIPYMGSSTIESTSILQSWERETKMPIIKRAAKLRNVIGWFVNTGSHLAQSILNNIQSLTGEDWSGSTIGFKRTGSALHRFNCSRQSSGGYPAQNPTALTRMISTTNTLSDIKDQNYDFMFQNCLLVGLMNTFMSHSHFQGQGYYHSHIKCDKCLREIDNIYLECTTTFIPVDVSNILQDWKPSNSPWSIKNPIISIQEGQWDHLSRQIKSYHVGVAQGFIFGDSTWGYQTPSEDPALFPLTLQNKLDPQMYIEGLLHGILRSAMIGVIHLRTLPRIKAYHYHILGHASLTIDRLSSNSNMINIWRSPNFIQLFSQIPHQIPSSYPVINSEAGLMGQSYMKSMLQNNGERFLLHHHTRIDDKIWIFSDVNKPMYIGLLALSEEIYHILRATSLSKQNKERLITIRHISSSMRDISTFDNACLTTLGPLLDKFRTVPQEVRHALKSNLPKEVVHVNSTIPPLTAWGRHHVPPITAITVNFNANKTTQVQTFSRLHRYQNPLISGLRVAQLATGSFYKLVGILDYLNITPIDALCGGDGSGGISALLLRRYPNMRLIFNSICKYENVVLKGNCPAPPSAINQIIPDSGRCVNLNDCWANPNDLADPQCWNYFQKLSRDKRMQINLIILDMEVTELNTIRNIENQLTNSCEKIGMPDVTIIYKTYLTYLFQHETNILSTLGPKFATVKICTTGITSSQSSEVYICFQGLLKSKNHLYSFIDWNKLYQDIKGFPVFRTEQQEFQRALRLKRYNLFAGVPTVFIPQKNDDLSRLLNGLGIRADISYRLGDLVNEDCLDRGSLAWATFICVTNYILSFTVQFKYKPTMPSDGVVGHLAIWTTGFLIWYGYATECYQISSLGQRLIHNYFPFFFNPFKNNKPHFWIQRWSMTEPSESNKHIHLDSVQGDIGRVIRVLTRCFSHSIDQGKTTSINKYCFIINPGMTYEIFMQYTGIVKLMELNHPLFPIEPSIRTYGLLESKYEETEYFWKS